MEKVEIFLTEELKQEINEIMLLKSYVTYVAKEEDVIFKILELYTSRYKNMIKGSVHSVENAIRKK